MRRLRSRFAVLVVLPLCLLGLTVARAVPADSAPPSRTAVIDASAGKWSVLSPGFLGTSANGYDTLSYGSEQPTSPAAFTPPFSRAARTLDPETVRGPFPGTGSNYLNWRTGTVFFNNPELPDVTTQSHGYTLDQFAAMVRMLDATPIFDLNVMTYCPDSESHPRSTSTAAPACPAPGEPGASSACPTSGSTSASAALSCEEAEACGPNVGAYLASSSCTSYAAPCQHPLAPASSAACVDDQWGLAYQVAMLRAAQSMGVPIKFIELGNELYDSGSYSYFVRNATSYVNKVNAWIPVLKRDFPRARVAVVGFVSGDCNSDYETGPLRLPPLTYGNPWNATVLAGVRGEDAITLHPYYADNLTPDPVIPGSVEDPRELAVMLSTAAQDCAVNLTTRHNSLLSFISPRLDLWMTEWGLAADPNALMYGSWAQGLTEATFATELARQPRVQLATNYGMFNGDIWGSIFNNAPTGYSDYLNGQRLPQLDYCAAAPGQQCPPEQAMGYGLTAAGWTLSLLERSLHGATDTATLRFSSGPRIAMTRTPGLIGQVFKVHSRTNLFIINLSGQSVNLVLSRLSGHYSELQYFDSPTTFVTDLSGNGANGGVDGTVSEYRNDTVARQLSLRPYSVTSLVELRR